MKTRAGAGLGRRGLGQTIFGRNSALARRRGLGRTIGVGLGAVTLLSVACTSEWATDEEQEILASRQQAAVTPVTISFRNGALPTSSYAGTDDTTIRQGSPTTNYGTTTACELDGDDGSGVDKTCLVKWAIAGIPTGSIVQSVTLTFRIVDSTGHTYTLYDAARAWTESQATWNLAATGNAWGTPGALASSDRGASVGTITGSTGARTVTLNAAGVAMVQRWVNGGLNAGVIMAHATNTNGLDLASSEHSTVSYRPTLAITYLPPETPGSGGASGAGGSSGVGGATFSGGAPGSGGISSGGAAGSGGAGTGGAGTGGAGTGGAGTGGTSGTPTVPNLLVAFIGDQGANGNSDAVLNLIKTEGAAATVHNGDFDYADNPTSWDNRVTGILGANYPYFATIGNHDAAAWGGSNGYGAKVLARLSRVPEMQCTGAPGVQSDCFFRGLHLVQSCVGTNEYTGASCTANSTTQVNFIRSSLLASNAVWEVCSWHKNQRDMQIGTKSDEVGWNAYRECQTAGAMIATGHEHSYGRTLTLTNLGTPSAGHGATGLHDSLQLGAGRTFVFVSGLAGVGIRAYDAGLHDDDTWWSSQYATNRWMKYGVLQSGVATYGALFIRFYVDGDPKKAFAYFKDVNGRIVDSFTIWAS